MEVYLHSMSHASSPQSSVLPSPPSSPGSSFSSLPSSAFSLSVPSSPPRHDSPLPPATHSLILPSLSLDTNYGCVSNLNGEMLGHVKLLILGSKGSGKTLLAETLVHGNPDVMEVGEWVDDPGLGRLLSAETRMESETMGAPGNVRLVEAVGFDQTDDPQMIVTPILEVIHSQFRRVLPLLSQTHPPDSALRDLLASSQSQLFTAVLLLTSTPPTPLENTLLSILSTHVPVIPITSPLLPCASRSSSRARSRAPRANASSLRPLTPHHLRTTLFRRPAALRRLRCEAAERFLWWREIETVKQQPGTLQMLLHRHGREGLSGLEQSTERWDWETRLSRDVAFAKETMAAEPGGSSACLPHSYLPLDPLHIPSLFLLSVSLFQPLRDSVTAGIKVGSEIRWWAVTVVGAFCTGVGVGWLLGSA